MVASLTYRTTDNTRWGGGLGSDLSATQVDINFWTLFSALQALEDHQFSHGAGIDYINQPSGGNLFYIHLTNHAVLGPFVIPTAQWTPRGAWQPSTAYAAYDVVQDDGSLYLITIPHTSGATFSAFATDGIGHLLYVQILSSPTNVLPTNGTVGQRLVKQSGSPIATAWESDLIRLALFIEGKPQPSELLLQYAVADHMVLPAGLIGSVIFQGTPTSSNVFYTITKNGAALGTINFNGPSPETISVAFGASVACVPGDVLAILGPIVPDANQANISITLVAELTA